VRNEVEVAVARERRRRERWHDLRALLVVVAVVVCVYWNVPLPPG
jgi:hypothetical protein